MNACGLIGFDLGACLYGMAFGWVAGVPWWVWAVAALIVVGAVYKFAGWLGVVTLAAGAGYFAGRRSVDPHEHVDGPDAEPAPPRPKPATRPLVPPKSLTEK